MWQFFLTFYKYYRIGQRKCYTSDQIYTNLGLGSSETEMLYEEL